MFLEQDVELGLGDMGEKNFIANFFPRQWIYKDIKSNHFKKINK